MLAYRVQPRPRAQPHALPSSATLPPPPPPHRPAAPSLLRGARIVRCVSVELFAVRARVEAVRVCCFGCGWQGGIGGGVARGGGAAVRGHLPPAAAQAPLRFSSREVCTALIRLLACSHAPAVSCISSCVHALLHSFITAPPAPAALPPPPGPAIRVTPAGAVAAAPATTKATGATGATAAQRAAALHTYRWGGVACMDMLSCTESA